MTRTQILPTLLIVIDVLSAVVYATASDWRRVIYWAAAAALTASVTF